MAGHLKAILAEFIGTFALVFAAAAAVCMDSLSGGRVGLVGIALAYAGAACAMTQAYSRVSGAHFNPAITLALAVHGRLDWIKGTLYVVAQLLGASLAAILLRAVLHDFPSVVSAGAFLGSCGGSAGFKAGTLIECVLTFSLTMVFYSSSIHSSGNPPGLAVGAVIAAAVLSAYPLTGAALNPARAFGPSIAAGQWHQWYVYWIGPLSGAALAATLYEALYLEKR